MDIYLTNTLSHQKELFKPLTSGQVGMYHCGPTVYWNQHIGNMRAVVIADFLRRTFEYNNYKVTLVRNYTDVGHLTGDNIGDADTGEDRMTKAVQREHLTPDEIADKYIALYNRDITSLNTIPPTNTPRATEHISGMIEMVQKLLDDGFAYTTDTAVYFDVSKYTDYTKLSGQKLDLQETGTGHGDASDMNKKNPHDFALWFFKTGAHANALQTWPSPFTSSLAANGEGFPGWHIECSAMSKYFLGETFDIHLGGIEHIPIHHTNEIAQSTCANHTEFVHYWLHNEHLVVDGKKMAKSEGTSYLMSDIIEKEFSPLALRYFFLQAHYRSKQNFTWDALEASQTAWKKLRVGVQVLPEGGMVDETRKTEFQKLVNDDLNTAAGLAFVWELMKDTIISDADKRATILDFDQVLGLKLDEVEEAIEIPAEVQKLLDERAAARTNKDFSLSDKIRNDIKALGFEVKDTDQGQTLTQLTK
ncbi:MAG: cysteine--tRNA ligase [Candidatus Pacebacteria bacterium]|nr:cysteine--tRNA ligase [Candidatus Paceibacterota bacterium]